MAQAGGGERPSLQSVRPVAKEGAGGGALAGALAELAGGGRGRPAGGPARATGACPTA